MVPRARTEHTRRDTEVPERASLPLGGATGVVGVTGVGGFCGEGGGVGFSSPKIVSNKWVTIVCILETRTRRVLAGYCGKTIHCLLKCLLDLAS